MSTSPIAEEATRLFAALQDWARERAPGLTAAVGQHVGGSQECTLCPVCQLLALVRGAQPEVYDHLLAAVSSLSAAATTLLESEAARSRSARPGVQHIDIG